jgi:predicted dehydrogenase
VIRMAVVGLGKMGLSHQALVNAHPHAELAAVCDASSYVLGVLRKYTGVRTYNDFDTMLADASLDAIVIATPSKSHARMARAAIERGIHVFCEKPFTLDPHEAATLTRASRERRVVTQVGYHNRFVGAFREVKKLLDAEAIGRVSHVLAEAYGPVVLKQKGGTWRSKPDQGGGCLYDYGAHPLNLVNWYLGEPVGVGGSSLNKVFSREIDDEVHSTLYFSDGQTAQLCANWSDESYRKMTTRITIWGSNGRIYADRQECQAYLREGAAPVSSYHAGWNTRYTTDLTPPVWFYLRGEEYSEQMEYFIQSVNTNRLDGVNDFRSAAVTDAGLAMIAVDAQKGAATVTAPATHGVAPARRRRQFGLWRRSGARAKERLESDGPAPIWR